MDEEMATLSRSLTWEIPSADPGRLQSMGSQCKESNARAHTHKEIKVNSKYKYMERRRDINRKTKNKVYVVSTPRLVQVNHKYFELCSVSYF